MKALDKNVVADMEAAQMRAYGAQKIISDKISSVLSVLSKCYGGGEGPFNFWYEDAPEGEEGELRVCNNGVSLEFEYDSNLPQKVIANYNPFPIEFIYMDDEKIEAEVKAEIAAEEEKSRVKNEKKEAAKKAKEEMKAKAISKLTPDEVMALGL